MCWRHPIQMEIKWNHWNAFHGHGRLYCQRIQWKRLRQESELLSRSSSQHWSQSQSGNKYSIIILLYFKSPLKWRRRKKEEKNEKPFLISNIIQIYLFSFTDLQSYASTTNDNGDLAHVPCNENLSSTETLKWLGSMSDISTSSHATNSSYCKWFDEKKKRRTFRMPGNLVMVWNCTHRLIEWNLKKRDL